MPSAPVLDTVVTWSESSWIGAPSFVVSLFTGVFASTTSCTFSAATAWSAAAQSGASLATGTP